MSACLTVGVGEVEGGNVAPFQQTVFASLMILFAFTPRAAAAELTLSLAELASLLTASLSDAKLHLQNTPDASGSPEIQSFLKVGTITLPLPLQPKTFEADGGTYAYYLNGLDSGPITVTVVPSALRLTVPFLTHGAALVGSCQSGLCVPDDSLPEVQWTNGDVTFDLAPVALRGSLSLVLKSVDIGGTFTPDCKAAGNFITGGICDLIMSKARESVVTLKSDLDETLKDEVNDQDTQDTLSTAVTGYLKFGPVGQVQITSVVVDDANVSLTFCVGCGGN